jgi:ATP-dependent Clp protease ATP-binding subunit ClpA
MAPVFERFTDRARRVVVLAQEEARLLDHNFIGTEHLLLRLLHADDTAGQLLAGLGFGLDETRVRIQAAGKPRTRSPSGHIPFTSRAKKALEMSLREALQMGDGFIGSEHLLLGLLGEGGGLAGEILHEHGLQLENIRRTVSLVDRGTRRGEIREDAQVVVSVPADVLDRLHAEIARLRDLLAHHGIDPDPEPGLGDGGDAPVA